MLGFALNEYFEFHFQTQRFDTGAASDADATPTYAVYEANNDTAVDSGNCSKVDDAGTTGYYKARAQITSAAGYEVGKIYHVRVAATVNSVAGAAVVGAFQVVPANVFNSLVAGSDYLEVDTLLVEGVDATNQIRDSLVDDATRIDASALNTLSSHDPGATIAKAGDAMTLATGAITAAVIATDAIDADALKADAVAEIQSGLAQESTLTAIKGAGWTTETLVAIKQLVDDLEGRLTAARAGYLDELGAANIPADVDTLLARLTALRAGYLDNLSAGAVALEANVQTHAEAALAVYDPPTRAELTSDKAEIIAEVNANEAKIDTVDAVVDAIKAKTDNLPASPAAVGSAMTLTSAYDAAKSAASQASVDALNDITVADIMAAVVEGSLTLQQTLRLALAVLAGKSSGGGSSQIIFRDTADAKNRVMATVDTSGNRTDIVLDPS